MLCWGQHYFVVILHYFLVVFLRNDVLLPCATCVIGQALANFSRYSSSTAFHTMLRTGKYWPPGDESYPWRVNQHLMESNESHWFFFWFCMVAGNFHFLWDFSSVEFTTWPLLYTHALLLCSIVRKQSRGRNFTWCIVPFSRYFFLCCFGHNHGNCIWTTFSSRR